MSSHFAQPQSASHLQPIFPQGYQTDSQALDGQHNLNYHPHGQDSPHTTNGYTQLCRGYEAMPPEVTTSLNARILNPWSQMTQHTGQPAYAGMIDSLYPKIESQLPLRLQKSQLSSVGQAHYEQDVGELQGSANTAPARDTKAAPGSIPATTPLVVRRDGNGVQWIAFEFSTNRVKMKYTIRCDVESVDTDKLSPGFKQLNCIYPQGCGLRDQYRGNRFAYETEWKRIAWALA
ncbi:hypothetical protein FPRO04_13701 [Fusarium proliferatum]|nr:hypothetical protein FPRO04_13701 [Fusarium proliferatum]